MKKPDPKKIKKDAIYFIEKIIGMKLTSYQKEWLKLVRQKRKLCFMAFRSSGKTRQLFVHYFLWKAIVNNASEYLIISKTLPQAIDIMKDIRITVEANPFLKSLIPSNRSQTWSRTEIELKNHSRIKARAYNENVRGQHVDGLGCDELGEYIDHNILAKAVLPTIRAKKGFFIGVGTPKSELDLLHEIESDPGYSGVYFDRYPAEGDKGNLFEERYPDTKVVHKVGHVEIVDKKTNKILDTYSNTTWSQEFLLKPVSLKDRLFPDHLIQPCLDESQAFNPQPVNMKQYFMGVDFAMSAQSGSDYTVVTVIEKSLDTHKLKIAYMERWQGLDYNIQKERIKALADTFQITKALGDENSFGKTFIYDLKAMGVPIEGYRFTYQSQSKEEIIKALRDQFEKKGFIIPFSRDCVKTRSLVKILIDELTKFGIIFDMRRGIVSFQGTGKHDDTIISLALANFISRHISMACFKVVKGTQRTGSNPFMVAKTK